MSHSAGVKKYSSQRATRDAKAVSLLRKAGAIVTLVSNTPELCLHLDSTNHITGTSWNPYDTNKSCGGSSGGEVCIFFLTSFINAYYNAIDVHTCVL